MKLGKGVPGHKCHLLCKRSPDYLPICPEKCHFIQNLKTNSTVLEEKGTHNHLVLS